MVLYVPALKAKRGELRAFRNLDPHTLAAISPVWELPPFDPDKAPQDDIDSRLSGVIEAGDDRPQVDPHYFGFGGDPWELIRMSLRQLDDGQRRICPVYRCGEAVTDDLLYLVQASGVATLRLGRQELVHSANIGRIVRGWANRLALPLDSIHVVADFGAVEEDSSVVLARMLADFFAVCPAIEEARAVSILLGAFPDSLSSLGDDQVHGLARLDWTLYQEAVGTGAADFVGFGDYGVCSSTMAAGGRTPTPSIRYTADGVWYVVKGNSPNRHDYGQYHDLADEAVNLGVYAGPAFSWGDEMIEAVARRQRGPGNSTCWRAFATNHHLTFVARQLASLPVA